MTGPNRPFDEVAQEFVFWALAVLRLPVEESQPDIFRVKLSESDRDAFHGMEAIEFSFLPVANSQVEAMSTDHSLFRWLRDQLSQRDETIHSVPDQQPSQVHEISDALFSAYQVEGGSVHLSGCTLEDEPFLRLTFCNPESDRIITHRYFDTEWHEADREQIRHLGLDDIRPEGAEHFRFLKSDAERWAEAVGGIAYETEDRKLIATAIVWCKRTNGKLEFYIDGATAELPFSAWARPLALGSEKPPSYFCPDSELKSYQIVATENGEITVPEATAICEETGQRQLKSRLQKCPVTGRTAAQELFTDCPASGQRLLKRATKNCSTCCRDVSPQAVRWGSCSDCRRLAPVDSESSELTRLQSIYPQLKKWKNWRLATTPDLLILVASAPWQRRLYIFDAEDFELKRSARGNRFSTRWVDAPADLGN